MGLEERDNLFMSQAFDEAKVAYSMGQLPIGAVLVINNKVVGVNSNSQVDSGGWSDHAENILILREQRRIKEAKKNSIETEIYSTLEPCLQCFGSIVHNRIRRVIYACPDPVAGATNIEPPTEWYANKWPEIVKGPFARESYELVMKFMKENPESWKNVIPAYEHLSQTL